MNDALNSTPNTETPPVVCDQCKGTGGLRSGEYCACSIGTTARDKHMRSYASLPNSGSPRTFDNFERNPANSEAMDAALEFANGRSANPVLTFFGPNGTGKSHLLEAIGRHMMAQGKWVKYTFSADLLDNLRASYGEDATVNFEHMYERYTKPPVLLLDDLGAEKSTEWAVEKLTRILDERYRADRPLAVATNLTEDTMSAKLGPRLADRLFDHRTGKVKVVVILGTSYRTGRRWSARGG